MAHPLAAARGQAAGEPDFRFRLLNEFQRAFPLVPQPYAVLADQLGTSEARVLEALAAFRDEGALSRVGAVFTPNVMGVSTLAALDVPAAALERVAAVVSARPEVNHNYEREGEPNLWFVMTAPGAAELARAAREIEADAGCGPVLLFPLMQEYRIDLGFDLAGRAGGPRPAAMASPLARLLLSSAERQLVAALQSGLALDTHPYRSLAQAAGLGEGEVLQRLQEWIDLGIIRRFGLILRHRELGYHANAMVVWDVPDALVDAIGVDLARRPDVTLCYRCRRAPPVWPYNLYCMIHGREREAVLARLCALDWDCGLARFPRRVLFSRRRFKQRGARYAIEERA